MKRKRWTKEEILLLKAIYPYYPNYVLEKVFGRSKDAIRVKAREIGVKKGWTGKLPPYIKAIYDRVVLRYISALVRNNEHGRDI